MFTGIVQDVGRIVRLARGARGARMELSTRLDLSRIAIGDSVAVDGCCLTVVDKGEGRLAFDLSEETLSRTRFARLAPGTRVNLEPALRVGDPLGGHWVSGHVDALGEVVELAPAEDGASFVVRLPDALLGYVAVKGSVAINGVSLTINAIEGDCIRMHLIPHTLAHTNLGEMAGACVHVEVDLIARYLARWLEVYGVRR